MPDWADSHGSNFRNAALQQEDYSFVSHDYPSDYPEPETAVVVLKRGYRIKGLEHLLAL